jgi:hypothetical protein
MFSIGQKFVYKARNSVFEIITKPDYHGGTYLVQYPATGAYRRYSHSRIADECAPYSGPPDEKNVIAIIPTGCHWTIEVDARLGTLCVNGETSKPGVLQKLIAELKERGTW